MSTSDYILYPAVGGSAADSGEYNQNLMDIEDAILNSFGPGVISGGTGTDGGGLTLNIAASVYLIGIKLSKVATSILLSPSTTNHIWVVTDPDDSERCYYLVKTNSTVPDRATPILSVVTGASSITTISNHANRVDITSYATALNKISNLLLAVATASITVGVEVANVISVSIQFKDVLSNNLSARIGCQAWLATAADSGAAAVAPTGGWSATAGYKVLDHTTNLAGEFVSNSSGLLTIAITESGAKTYYLHVKVGGRVYVSGAVTFV